MDEAAHASRNAGLFTVTYLKVQLFKNTPDTDRGLMKVSPAGRKRVP